MSSWGFVSVSDPFLIREISWLHYTKELGVLPTVTTATQDERVGLEAVAGPASSTHNIGKEERQGFIVTMTVDSHHAVLSRSFE